MRNFFDFGSLSFILAVGLAATGVSQWLLEDNRVQGARIPMAIDAPTVSQLRHEVHQLRESVKRREREPQRESQELVLADSMPFPER